MFPPFCRCRLLSGFLCVLENVYVSPWPALTANYISGGPSQCKAHCDQRDGVIGDARNATTGPDSQWAALMMGTTEFAQGGYQYIPAVFQYSGGVAALRGFEIRRVRFRSPIPLSEGFDTIERIIGETGRPLTSFCACELRSPAPFTDQGFRAFNEIYVTTLRKWGLMNGDANPVARSNVCPVFQPPPEPSLHAFSFTTLAKTETPTFVIAGSGEAREGGASYAERTVRHGDVSPDAMREKARFVLDEMERRMRHFGFGWSDTTASQVYTVHDLHPFFADEIVRRDAAHAGLTWHLCNPPVRGLEYEMDCRAIMLEQVV
jgi:hypothetical protein